MAKTANSALWVGVACAAMASLALALLICREDRGLLSLHELEHGQAVLALSCGDTDFGSSEPLWCNDPSSPQCIPAVPPAPGIDLWDGPVAALLSEPVPPARVGVLVPWPKPSIARTPPSRDRERLERPPRA